MGNIVYAKGMVMEIVPPIAVVQEATYGREGITLLVFRRRGGTIGMDSPVFSLKL
ncbi:hypothetical protein [Treponema phagedenis]|uniref:hypothetical protein n=1 Tax=Treponema phagedenis TaxID=162 RepID=UPI0004B7251B|nr:hypothetical protein [Treponema phagedenis]QKS92919.1 hypothetical protein HPJ96_10435 [Treponema phagedenis]QLC58878.1 hypothetical protein HW453_08755 [Treponema phagedenis]